VDAEAIKALLEERGLMSYYDMFITMGEIATGKEKRKSFGRANVERQRKAKIMEYAKKAGVQMDGAEADKIALALKAKGQFKKYE
jgi:hypothetical protein